MIELAQDKHKNQIAGLLSEAFGDSTESSKKLFDLFREFCVVFEKGEMVAGTLFMIPIEIEKKKGRYIYAVATLKKCRGQGIATSLLTFAKKYIEEMGEDFLLLVPSSDGLISFYEKNGFNLVTKKQDEVFKYEERESGAEIVTVSHERYYNLRKTLCKENLAVWSPDMLSEIKEITGGTFYEIIKNNEILAAAFCVKEGERFLAKELLGDSKLGANLVCKYLGVSELPANIKKDVMVYPKRGNVYFNLAME